MNKLFERIKLLFNNTLNIIGPSPAFIPKKAGRYWWQLIIKTDEKQLIDVINKLSDIMTTDWIMDVDPIGMI
jgi:primosomal protein N'